MKKTILFFFISVLIGCNNPVPWKNYDESIEIEKSKRHSNKRMQFKLIQSKYEFKNDWFKNINKELNQFSEKEYNFLKPLVIEKSIPEIQTSILEGKLTYEKLVVFYFHRYYRLNTNERKTLLLAMIV